MRPARDSTRGAPPAVWLGLFVFLALNTFFWTGARDVFMKWGGVPPVPTKTGALAMSLGDTELAFRLGAFTLQGLGDGGGQTARMSDYDYKKLERWFWLMNELDPASDHVPMLASYYFSASSKKEDIMVLVNYLGTVGQSPYGSKWRWLAQAVLMARHKLNNLDLALDLAYKLSKMQPIGETLPHWARQMPAFVLAAKGDKEDARKLMEDMLLTSERFHPNEVNFMKGYLIEQLGVPPEEVEALMKKRQLPIVEDLEAPKTPAYIQ